MKNYNTFLFLLSHIMTSVLCLTDQDRPHCSTITPVTGDWTLDHGDKLTVKAIVDFGLSLHETACYQVLSMNETIRRRQQQADQRLIYTLTYVRERQIYPIADQYDFAIPLIETNCVCDCADGERHCVRSDHNRRPVTHACGQGLCFRTWRSDMSAHGCVNEHRQHAGTVCCSVRMTPHANRLYTAYRFDVSNYFVTVKYRMYTVHSDARVWNLLVSRTIYINVDQPQLVDLNIGDSTIRLTHRPHSQSLLNVNEIFYTEANHTRIMHGIPVNSLREFSLHQLGWFRLNRATQEWQVGRADINLKHAHQIKVLNCQTQLFEQIFNARYYVFKSYDDAYDTADNVHGERHKFGSLPIEQDETWIDTLSINNEFRRLEIDTNTAGPLHITVALSNVLVPTVVWHRSQLGHFFARITVDSNRRRLPLLNITVVDTYGTVLGDVYHTELNARFRSRSGQSFSFHVPAVNRSSKSVIKSTKQVTVPLPPELLNRVNRSNTAILVCLHLVGNATDSCQFAPVQYFKSQNGRVEDDNAIGAGHEWVRTRGKCTTCNAEVESSSDDEQKGSFLGGLLGSFNGHRSVTGMIEFVSRLLAVIVAICTVGILLKCVIIPICKPMLCKKN